MCGVFWSHERRGERPLCLVSNASNGSCGCCREFVTDPDGSLNEKGHNQSFGQRVHVIDVTVRL